MRVMPWTKMPVRWIHSGHMADGFKWRGTNAVTGSSAIASLMIWIALVTQSQEDDTRDKSVDEISREVDVTYERLMRLTGLSKKLVAAGIEGLRSSHMVVVKKIGRINRYVLTGYERGSWTKVPARALYEQDRIVALHHFNKRSACELHALKLYLYYASVRNRAAEFAMVSFEKIHERTGVPEKSIPVANSFLLTSGLMARVVSEQQDNGRFKEANKYYLRGYTDLFIGL